MQANAAETRRPAHLAEIVFHIDPDSRSALRRLRRGELDVLPRVEEFHHPDQTSATALGPGLRALRVDEPRWSFVAINHHHPALADPRIRAALDRSWNRSRIAAEAHRGLASPISSLLATVQPPTDFSPAGAAAQLDGAGLGDSDRDRVREREGRPLAFTLLTAQGSFAAKLAGQRFVQDAARAGLRIDVLALDAGELRERLRAGKFDLALLSWWGRPDEDLRPLFGTAGAFNHGGFSAPEVQAVLDELALIAEPAARAPLNFRLARGAGPRAARAVPLSPPPGGRDQPGGPRHVSRRRAAGPSGRLGGPGAAPGASPSAAAMTT